MGYFSGKEFDDVTMKMKAAIEVAMEKSDNGVSYIDRWAFDSSSNVVLMHVDDCGCARDVAVIDLGLNGVDAIMDEELILQIEDILLEVDVMLGNSNFMLYMSDYSEIIKSCNVCGCK